jgi:hypothetical protein
MTYIKAMQKYFSILTSDAMDTFFICHAFITLSFSFK